MTIQVVGPIICCAFVADCDIKRLFFILITDTARPISCAGAVLLYVSITSRFGWQNYYWRITLIDPREKDKILFDGNNHEVWDQLKEPTATIPQQVRTVLENIAKIEFKNGKYAGSGFSDSYSICRGKFYR